MILALAGDLILANIASKRLRSPLICGNLPRHRNYFETICVPTCSHRLSKSDAASDRGARKDHGSFAGMENKDMVCLALFPARPSGVAESVDFGMGLQ